MLLIFKKVPTKFYNLTLMSSMRLVVVQSVVKSVFLLLACWQMKIRYAFDRPDIAMAKSIRRD